MAASRDRGPGGHIAGYVAAVALLGGACLVLMLVRYPPSWNWGQAFAPLALTSVMAILVPLRYQHGRGVQGFTLDEGVLIAMLFVLSGAAPALVMVGATLLAHLILRARPAKLAFNVGQMAMAASVGFFLFQVVGVGPEVLSARSVSAAVVAAGAHNVVNSVALAGLFQRLEGRSVRETLSTVWRPNAVTLLGNISFGLVLAVVARVDPAATLLASTLLVGLYLGYRGYVGQLDERRRAEALHAFTRSLLTVSAVSDYRGEIFTRVLDTLEGSRALLALAPDGGEMNIVTHRPGSFDVERERLDQVVRRMLREIARRETAVQVTEGSALAAVLGEIGERDAMAAPIYGGNEVVGSLMVFGRRGLEPWGENHLTLLATMATELSVSLENVDLFQQVEEERARLEAETTKLNNILGAATDGISSFLADGTIEAWNPGMARITGVPGAVAVGKPWHAILRLKDADGVDLAPTGDHVVARSLTGDLPAGPLTLQALRSDGEWRRLECTASPVRDPDGGHRGLVVVARDVTAERELEELKSDFIATVSHELRTPLTPLKGFLATLRNSRTALTDDQLDSVHGSMATQLARLETLISDLLAVAELDHGQFNLYPEPLALGELVPEAVEVEAADQYARCTVTVDPDATAVADAVALVRVLRSLVSNAVKHTEGHVEVTVRTVEDRVEVAVADEGPGIASWDQQRVFNRFERLGNHLRRTQGPGLGLTIARTLAQRMGGDVRVSSDIGRGAVFTLSLPRARPRALPQASASLGEVDEAVT